jgi:hypothetical protein
MQGMRKPRWSLWSSQRHRRSDRSRSVAEVMCAISTELDRLSQNDVLESEVFRQQVALRLHDKLTEITDLAAGKLVFSSTETWRTVYQQVLESADAKRYLSVALIRTDDYWRDAPGESSLKFNYELVAHGFHIHRVVIIDDFFWPRASRTPSKQLFHWILDQYHRGIEVSLIRLTDLDDEPTLVCDIGIYGRSAVGQQQTDFEGKTTRFELCFAANALLQAEQHWQQLMVYAQPLPAIIDEPLT